MNNEAPWDPIFLRCEGTLTAKDHFYGGRLFWEEGRKNIQNAERRIQFKHAVRMCMAEIGHKPPAYWSENYSDTSPPIGFWDKGNKPLDVISDVDYLEWIKAIEKAEQLARERYYGET